MNMPNSDPDASTPSPIRRLPATGSAGRKGQRVLPPTDGSDPQEQARWAAVLRRDRSAEAAFVYAVRTTGVFCRPGCPSRPPRRHNVEYFDDAQSALRAGYRPCKRCRPALDAPRDTTAEAVIAACRMLESSAGARSQDIAARVGLSPAYFVRAFKATLGVPPQAYRRRVLAERAKRNVAQGTPVTQAALDAGYASSGRFYAGAGQEIGMPAVDARRGGRGQRVLYAVRTCSLGHLLVAWTGRGVCDVRFGDTDADVRQALHARFPAATLCGSQVPAWLDAVMEAVERPMDVQVPLDIQGTAFQQRVWAELRRIPVGQTRTYAQVAEALGGRRLTRAVARACAHNELALLVPCHRVVRSDGKPSGYRWHLDRKAELLRRERAQEP